MIRNTSNAKLAEEHADAAALHLRQITRHTYPSPTFDEKARLAKDHIEWSAHYAHRAYPHLRDEETTR